LRAEKPKHYTTREIDLGTARSDEELPIIGDFLLVQEIDGALDVRVNETRNKKINLQKIRQVKTPFYRLFLTNSAQSGKKAVLLIGREASMEAKSLEVVGLVDKQANDINPATDYIEGRSISYEDTSFVSGDSPAVCDVNGDLGRNGHDGYIINDGPGDIQVEISDNGTDYGGVHTLKAGERISLTRLDVNRIRLTWVSDSAYRILVI